MHAPVLDQKVHFTGNHYAVFFLQSGEQDGELEKGMQFADECSSRLIFRTWRGAKNSPNKRTVQKSEPLLLWDNLLVLLGNSVIPSKSEFSESKKNCLLLYSILGALCVENSD